LNSDDLSRRRVLYQKALPESNENSVIITILRLIKDSAQDYIFPCSARDVISPRPIIK
jgi:hypothetical protein